MQVEQNGLSKLLAYTQWCDSYLTNSNQCSAVLAMLTTISAE